MLACGAPGAAVAQAASISGRLEMAGGGTCGATFVAPSVVATAAHCLPGDGAAFRFRMPRAAALEVRETLRHPAFALTRNPRQRTRFDVALVRLEGGRSEEPGGPFVPLGPPARVGEVLTLETWRRDEGSFPRRRACTVMERGAEQVVLDCAVAAGHSGAPVLREGSDGAELVAIVTSRLNVAGQGAALATDARVRVKVLLDLMAR